jgi:Protein of unknown function (DUF1592)/Protein of unknown function (DUF1588)/Protein of unknown function (DUF1587)/Protein of unknown function (DUF1595)/Protein of unknown function (DUF1585)/Ca-dependent carbohydrate-binding module xylan-binding
MWRAAGLALIIGCQGDGCGANGAAEDAADAGTVVVHRLNRAEYNNTVRDLLGTTSTPADDFPADDTVAGWDNIAATLSVSPLHLELYELAAQSLADEVVTRPVELVTERIEAEGPDTTGTVGAGGPYGETWIIWSSGEVSTTVDIDEGGLYELVARVWAQQAGPDLATASWHVDGLPVFTGDVRGTGPSSADLLSVEVRLDEGVHTLSVSFDNDYWNPDTYADRNLYVDYLEFTGPTDAVPGPNPMRDRWVTCDPLAIGDTECAEVALRALADQAWRRPVTDAEVGRLLDTVVEPILADGGTFDDALKWGIVSVLVSPHFLYRVELDSDPDSLASHDLSQYELASRLSYFLWSSMPDEALFAAAAAGELATQPQIKAQVARMLADAKAQALVDNFGGQWLYIRGIEDILKDPATFPEFDDTLKASMREEMDRFFASFVFAPRDLRELLTATEGEIDAVLAEHYDIRLSGDGWQTVDLAAHQRGGLLGQAGVLTVASYPTRTSPVIRGKFVLDQLLCDEPPPPPSNIPALEEQSDAVTVREQLEQHRADPVCASCHETMDNIGFGLETYDAIGRWRTEDQGYPIDATGLLYGVDFDGPQELTALLADDPRLTSCMVEQAFTYGLGRLAEDTDEQYLHNIGMAFAAGGYTFQALAVAIASSEPFTTRRGAP